ncbi:MAG: shikimate dehydrogenase [Thermodesulfobacteriota bacterium]
MQISGRTQVYGIIGWPVTHSLSPLIHNAAFAACGLDKVYVPLPVRDVAPAMAGMRGLGLRGASVTIPHKQAVIDHLDDLDPVARRIGAVNTLVVGDDGRITGYNTDWLGANRALAEQVPLAGSHVLLVGSGGSARAIGFGLREAGARVTVANRGVDRGKLLAAELGADFLPLAEIAGCDATVLVNATSLGMAPDADATPVAGGLLGSFAVVMDIVYAPLETRLLREAKAAGCRVIDGLAMLLYQGVAQFELWTGVAAPVAVMRDRLYSLLDSHPPGHSATK